LPPHIEEFWKKAIPIIWCYRQLQSPNSTLRYTILTSYIYHLIFTKSLWLHSEKGKCENFFLCNYPSGLPLSIHRPVTSKNTGKYDSIGDKKEKSMCTMNYAFCLLTLKSSEKRRSPLFGATGNFNHQILPYGILFLTFVNTDVFYNNGQSRETGSIGHTGQRQTRNIQNIP
jgi:hypothetical protein